MYVFYSYIGESVIQNINFRIKITGIRYSHVCQIRLHISVTHLYQLLRKAFCQVKIGIPVCSEAAYYSGVLFLYG